ncbi:RNA-binding motif, single-stranded-interacting protein 3 [Takifugu flavidus]|uniref:RNA-binding motif, single-stranded-interacting protein 3 n=1 Tax=Takifugu flavidus TaxID=433684 RepID=A0A5C6NEI9_9TELE|nr:RNA-binding motif, single-stranded-interacting protein 3 [Takifugu flavidus]
MVAEKKCKVVEKGLNLSDGSQDGDGGQKKRQSQSKYPQNGRPWHREGETGMALTYDPTAMQNGFYSSPYSIATNRMIAQTSITPFIAASPVSTYQVGYWAGRHGEARVNECSCVSVLLRSAVTSAPDEQSNETWNLAVRDVESLDRLPSTSASMKRPQPGLNMEVLPWPFGPPITYLCLPPVEAKSPPRSELEPPASRSLVYITVVKAGVERMRG